MKKIPIVAGALTLTACTSSMFTVPENRAHYIELMQQDTGIFSSLALVYSKEFNTTFESATKNIEKKISDCIPSGWEQHPTSNFTTSHYNKVTNNVRIHVVNGDKAEVTFQQHHTDTAFQSEGGLYLLAADVFRVDDGNIKIDFYTSTTQSETAEAVEQWAMGSDKCHGMGGND
ncbi:hypothetical protein [Parasalinivibrio latis]|uniref:hypothetical protein n=1 Tax=Parasalinivibrio latis TaxID=2952610 RepID=UPI003DA2F366